MTKQTEENLSTVFCKICVDITYEKQDQCKRLREGWAAPGEKRFQVTKTTIAKAAANITTMKNQETCGDPKT